MFVEIFCGAIHHVPETIPPFTTPSEKTTKHCLVPRWVGEKHGVVQAIGIAVIVQWRVGILNKRIGTQKPRHHGIVDTAVHIDDANSFKMFVHGVAPIGEEATALIGFCPVGVETPVAPWIVCETLHYAIVTLCKIAGCIG